jgi:hypothetical protein
VVPGSRFKSARDLKDRVLTKNPASQYRDNTSGSGKSFYYNMTTGDILELEDIVGGSSIDRCYTPIKSIKVGGRTRKLADEIHDRCDAKERARMPLLDVKAVDARTYASKGTIAFAGGDGRVVVNNPHTKSTLDLDSRNYKAPKRAEKTQGRQEAKRKNKKAKKKPKKNRKK